MVLRDYINSIPNPRMEVIRKIAEITDSNISTVYRWMSGAINPPTVKKRIIAKHLGIPVDELFPPKDNVPCSQK